MLKLFLFAIFYAKVWLIPLEQNPQLFEGDMIVPQDTKLRTLAYLGTNKWPNGILPWRVDQGVFTSSELQTITNALKTLEDNVNADGKQHIKIVSWSNQINWIQIIKDSGCYSYVGCINTGAQSLSLGTGCVYTGIIQHEALHALGFLHEQSRPDRDNYVTVNFTNIVDGMSHNFDKYESSVSVYNLPYDLNSIMHYGPYYFSKNGYPTIIPKNQSVTIGQRDSMSVYDIEAVRLHYPTNDTMSSTATTVSNITTIMSTTTARSNLTTTVNTTIAITSRTRKTTTISMPRRGQKSKVKGSLRITVDLSRFDNDTEFRENITNILKNKLIEKLQQLTDFLGIVDYVLTKLENRKRQVSTTVVDQYTLVLNTNTQRDVTNDVLTAASEVANDLSGSINVVASNEAVIDTTMVNNSATSTYNSFIYYQLFNLVVYLVFFHL